MILIAGAFAALVSMTQTAGVDAEAAPRPVRTEANVHLLWGGLDGIVGAGEVSAKVVTGADSIRLQDDLGYDKVAMLSTEVGVPVGNADLLGFHGLFMRSGARERLEEQILYDDGVVFFPGEEVRSEFNLSFVHLGYDRTLDPGAGFLLRAGGGVGLQTMHMTITRHRQPPLSDDSSEEVETLTPFLHLSAEHMLTSDLHWKVDLRGSPVSFKFYPGEPADARFLIAETSLRWSPLEWLSVEPGLGYVRAWAHFHGEEGDGKSTGNNTFDIRFLGPSLGIALKF